MSKINELIQTLCPDGVEYKKLGEVATISRGNGFQKKDFVEEGRPCIHYGQIFMHYSKIGIAASETLTCIDNDKYEKNAKALPNDIVMAVTSENVEDVCKCVVWEGDEPVAVSGHTAIFHTEMNSKFLAYWFGSSDFYVQKVRLAHGTKVIEVTPAAMVDIVLPVPPPSVQEEIVRILDEYTNLEAELEAKLSEEIELKQKQYEVYRDELLTFGDGVERKSLNDLCDYVDYRGKTPKKTMSGRFLVTAKNIGYGIIDYEKSKEYIADDDYDIVMRRGVPQIGDVLITTEAPMGHVAQVDDDTIALAQRVIKYCSKNKNVLSNDFLKHYCLGQEFQQLLFKSANNGGTVSGIKGSVLHTLDIPVPSLTEQQRIVKILESFNKSIQAMISALNTELESRKKQYAYYRDQLLTFKRKE